MSGTTSEQQAARAPVRYVPADIESKWMRRWLDAGIFHAEPDGDREPYTIVIPPPNVTGMLHMGHALNGSIQDALIRYKRMRGFDTLWLPGTDHAGIATQAVVERTLRAEGIDRHELGREKFLERVWDWKDHHGAGIIGQYQRLGASLDYERERFTMDDGYARAVLHAFVKLHEKGYIYRGNRLVNWDAGTMSAISDLEVRQVELDDELVSVAYPLADGDGEIVVATVRPETIFADVAVAVNPSDERYAGLVGRQVRVPMTDRVVPIIADDYVKVDFGTGALKITPGHDPNDFEIGERHGLEALSCIGYDCTMTDLAGKFAGRSADEVREASIAMLEELGLLRGREPYRHMVPHSDRSGVRIEPLMSLQWFCDMTELARPAIAAVESGEVRFVPDGAKNIFMTWMSDLKPWCLSRQLWWGHQLPVWYCGGEHVHVSIDGPDGSACPECGSTAWRRDEDVLDTWFSSGLWDFATLGWPEQTRELEYFHPTSVLCTAREIINLWVARMMMLSYEFLGEKPFSDVYIHSVVQAPDGRRMSKSLGTGIDPLELIDEFGADATRYGLLNMSSTQDVRFNKGKIQEGRDLANKLWNASRLLVMLGDPEALEEPPLQEQLTRLEDRWIWSRLHRTIVDLTTLMEQYDFALYTKTLYAFVWNELCDWYLEAVKERLRSEDAGERRLATSVLASVIDRTLRLVHPVMPHVTEEIAEQVWGGSGEADRWVVTSSWPQEHHDWLGDEQWLAAEAEFAEVQSMVSRLRRLRQAGGLAPATILHALADGDDTAMLEGWTSLLAGLANVEMSTSSDESSGVRLPVGDAAIVLQGLDAGALREHLATDLATAESEVQRAGRKLADERFTSRAPADLVEAERAKVDRHGREAEDLRAVLDQLD